MSILLYIILFWFALVLTRLLASFEFDWKRKRARDFLGELAFGELPDLKHTVLVARIPRGESLVQEALRESFAGKSLLPLREKSEKTPSLSFLFASGVSLPESAEPPPEATVEELCESLGAEGTFHQNLDTWTITHLEENFLRATADTLLSAAVRRVFELNQLKVPAGFTMPSLQRAALDESNTISLYFEDGHFIFFNKISKGGSSRTRYESAITPVPSFQRRSNRWNGALSYLLPELIPARLHSKRSFRKFGVQMLSAAAMLSGFLWLAMDRFSHWSWNIENSNLMAFLFFAFPLLILTALVLSGYFLFRGIFSSRPFLRTGL